MYNNFQDCRKLLCYLKVSGVKPNMEERREERFTKMSMCSAIWLYILYSDADNFGSVGLAPIGAEAKSCAVFAIPIGRF